MFNMTSKLKKSKNDLIYDLYNDHKIEKLNLNLCKSILGVGSKASNKYIYNKKKIKREIYKNLEGED